MAVLALVQVPPGVPSVSNVPDPMHALAVPLIANGNGLTVTGAVIRHPVPVIV